MADQGLNLHQAGRARLRSRRRQRQDVGIAARYRRPIVIASLVLGDLAAVLAADFCTRMLAEAAALPPPQPFELTALLVAVAFFAAGLYSGSGPGPYERFRQRTLGLACVCVIWTIDAIPEPTAVDVIFVQIANAVCLLVIGHYIEAAARAVLIHVDLWGARTVLVGTADQCRELAKLLARKPELGLKLIGLIRSDHDASPESGSFPLPVIGRTSDLARKRLRTDSEFAIFATVSELAVVLRDCPAFAAPCRFMLLQDIDTVQGPWLRTRVLQTMIGIEIQRDSPSRQNRLLKRASDMLLAVPIALLALPVVGLAALLIKLVDPGPAFYAQKRMGSGGRMMAVYKLRTMYTDSERLLKEYLDRNPQARAEWQKHFKLRNDPRVLPVIGNFLRRSSADELPQLWNVVCGDMSLVGPRPLPAYHAEQLDKEFLSLRASVPPGITGLWQVSSRSDGDLEALREQDLFYVRNWSPWLDFYILLQTIPAVLTAKGAR